MGLGFTRTIATGAIPVWQGDGADIQTYQGGFRLVTTGFTAGDVILAGTPVVVDEQARTLTILRTGIANAAAGGTATTYQVNKGSTLKVGDNFASGATGGKAYPITAIDTTNAAYDVLTVGTSIGAVAQGDTLYASTASGTSASALPAANGLLYREQTISTVDNSHSASAVVRGTVYARRVPYSAAIAALPGLKFIIYSQSY